MSTILISGATGNLGRAVAGYFHTRGWQVIAVVSPHADESVLAGYDGLTLLRVNAESEKAVEKSLESVWNQFSGVDAAVLTIGGYTGGTAEQTNDELMERMMKLNFYTAWHFARPLFALMKQRRRGKLVFIGSQAAVKPEEGRHAVAYSVSKAAVIKLSEVLHADGRDYGVQCRAILPSIIDTPQNRAAMPLADFSKWQKPEQLAAETGEFVLSEKA